MTFRFKHDPPSAGAAAIDDETGIEIEHKGRSGDAALYPFVIAPQGFKFHVKFIHETTKETDASGKLWTVVKIKGYTLSEPRLRGLTIENFNSDADRAAKTTNLIVDYLKLFHSREHSTPPVIEFSPDFF